MLDLQSRGDTIRTCDLVVPNDALYQAELHPEVLVLTQIDRESSRNGG